MKRFIASFALLCCFLASINARPDVPAKAHGKAGEQVAFQLVGSAVRAEFYSGEEFCDYEYAEKDRVVTPRMYMSFVTSYAKGKQYSPLRVKISTDYDGSGTECGINAATWTDITKMCALPNQIRETDGEDIQPTPSGRIDITGFFSEDGAPVYIGFFYRVEPFDRSQWNSRTMVSVREFKVDSDAAGITRNVLRTTRESVSIIVGESYGSDVNLPEYGGKGGKVTVRFLSEQKPDRERLAYAVTSAIKLVDPLVLGPDDPEKVEIINNGFSYVYKKKGVYNAVVVLYDGNGEKRISKVNVTIK